MPKSMDDATAFANYRQLAEREKQRLANRKERYGYRGAVIGCGSAGIRAVDLLQRTINVPSKADGCSMVDTVAIDTSAERLLRYSADLHVLADDAAAVADRGDEIRTLIDYLDYCFVIASADDAKELAMAKAAALVARDRCCSAATIALLGHPFSRESGGLEKCDAAMKTLAGAADMTIVLDRDAIERYRPGLAPGQVWQAIDDLTVAIVDMFFDYCVRSGGIDTYLYEVLSITRASDTGTAYYLEFDATDNPDVLRERFRAQAKDLPEKCTGLLVVAYVDANAGLKRVCEIVEAFVEVVRPEHGDVAWNVRTTKGSQRLMAIATEKAQGR